MAEREELGLKKENLCQLNYAFTIAGFPGSRELWAFAKPTFPASPTT
jgi:hypothetical protein